MIMIGLFLLKLYRMRDVWWRCHVDMELLCTVDVCPSRTSIFLKAGKP